MTKRCLNLILKPLGPVADLLRTNMVICCVCLTRGHYLIVRTIEFRLQHTGNAKLRCTFWIYNHYLVCATGQRPCSDTQVNVRSAWREKNWKLLDVGLSVLLCCISVRISFCKRKQCLSALLWNKSIYLTIKSIYAFILCPTVIVKTRVISILWVIS